MDSDTRNPWTELARIRLTARKPDESSTTHQARIAEDMRRLERALLHAKELYNSDSPISSLPDELLLDIFTRVRNAAAEQALDADEPPRAPSWDKSVALCRRFRRIVIESPSLHTRLSTATHSAAYIGHALARSEAIPIELDILQPFRSEAFHPIRLSTLILSHVNFAVTDYALVYSNLTVLSLRGVTVTTSPSSKYMDIVGLLEILPEHLRDLEYAIGTERDVHLLSSIVPSASVHLKLSEQYTSHSYQECQLAAASWMTAVGPPVRGSLHIWEQEHMLFGLGFLNARLDLGEDGQARLPNVSFRNEINSPEDIRHLLLQSHGIDYSHLHTLELRAIMHHDLLGCMSRGLGKLQLPCLRALIIDYMLTQPENEHDRSKIYYLYAFLRDHFDQTGPLDTLITNEYLATALEELGSTPQPPRAGQSGYDAWIVYDSESMPPLSLNELVSNVSIIAAS
ncbi:hypothetical protein PENSPDRAFT_754021 [Peniophora sp. CONT]|nr:hypothetical protein PENSPDRAFT_754021 [Peniophora sp. CONT]